MISFIKLMQVAVRGEGRSDGTTTTTTGVVAVETNFSPHKETIISMVMRGYPREDRRDWWAFAHETDVMTP